MRRFPFSRFAFALALFMSPVAGIAQQDNGATDLPDMAQIEEAWKREDYAFVRSGLERLATETGSSLAQYRYGRILVEGLGGSQDIDAAVMWLQKAVDQNHTGAATLLARVYLSDLDSDVPIKTKPDPARAADLLKMASALGFSDAQLQLALLYKAGKGVESDDKAAFRWLLASAQQGNAKAQFALAQAYSRGAGTPQDNAQTLRWLNRAASNGIIPAMISLGRTYEAGRGVDKSIPQAMVFYRQAADAGMPLAQYKLGTRLLYGGEGVAQDTVEGLRLLQSAAKAGSPNAMATLGQAYSLGKAVPQDDAQAARWYARAAQYEHGGAKVAFGAMQETGRGVELDFEAALVLYQRALEIPDGNTAAIRLGQLASNGALDGRFAPQRMTPWVLAAMQADAPKAEGWLLDQANAGLRAAQSGLASLYLEIPDKATQGADMLQRAAQGGDAEAQLRLGKMYMIGDRVGLDYVAAHQWLNIAATLGQVKAAELRTTVTILMTPDQIANAQTLARTWFDTGQPQPPNTSQTVTEDTQDSNGSTVRD